ncbi:hypothetical protein Len3610_05050 [Lentibacillus sp. CBA3610]|nr:hypothetical protein Len3610_05050 [Lentibacillus sp. CBA3610]
MIRTVKEWAPPTLYSYSHFSAPSFPCHVIRQGFYIKKPLIQLLSGDEMEGAGFEPLEIGITVQMKWYMMVHTNHNDN